MPTPRSLPLVLVLLATLTVGIASAEVLSPQPSSAYREIPIHVSSSGNQWRVTDPNATFVGTPGNSPSTFLPNPTIGFNLPAGALTGAVMAEVVVDYWGGHVGTIGQRLRFNAKPWLNLPELANTPTDAECYTQQWNPGVTVPLSHLQNGANTLEGTSGGQTCFNFNWGQWGWYGVVLRIYYDPAQVAEPTGSIAAPAANATIGENPTIQVNASGGGGIRSVEVLARYDGPDWDGDGVFLEYHQAYHRSRTATQLDTSGHVGTDTASPYNIVWNTQLVPDQTGIRLLARIEGTNGLTYVTPEITGIRLQRSGASVLHYKPQNVPRRFWVRSGSAQRNLTSNVTIPAGVNLSQVTSAKLVVRTWNGVDGQAEAGQTHGTWVNNHKILVNYGENHHYSIDVLDVPVAWLANGVNTIKFDSTSTHHGIEILWPGPELILRTGGVVSNPVCGNGAVETGEECDDGNTQNGDGCQANCTLPAAGVCGNGTVEAGEQCDDGNTQNGDGCQADCTLPVQGSALPAMYPFEETGATVVDIANDNDGTLVASAQRVNGGYFGKGLAFNGSSGHVDLGPLNVLGQMTLAMWIKADDFGISDARILSKASSALEQDHYFMLSTVSDGGNRLRFRLKTTNSGTATLIATGATLVAGEWIHAAATYNGSQMRLYQDGILAGSLAKTGGIVGHATLDAWIGDQPGGGKSFDGVIDEVLIDDSAYTANEILTLMSAPLGSPPANCGNGTVDAGEQCDDGNTANGDGCQGNCQLPDCGDGVVDPGEQCDDGNTANGDGCRNDCSLPECGDGVVDPGEQCDDGNTVDGDACGNDCVANGNSAWHGGARRYRVTIQVGANAFARNDRVAETNLVLGTLLSQAGGAGTVQISGLTLVEVTSPGALVDASVPFQFDGANSGTLVWILENATAANATRYYQLYFDTVAFTAPVFSDQVVVTNNVVDEGQQSYRVATDMGDWLFQKEAAGFSSLLDNSGNDWISYSTAAGSAGEYRGVPNLVYPANIYHPGFTSASSTLLHDGPIRATIDSPSDNGQFKTRWHFFPDYARMTVELATGNYWFLYEGTPGGQLDRTAPNNDFIVRSDGTQYSVAAAWGANGGQDIPGDEWVYFADPTVNRSLFLAHHTNDIAVDWYQPLDLPAGGPDSDWMTVFGFGRGPSTTSLLTGNGRQVTIGLMDTTGFSPGRAHVVSAYKDLSISVGPGVPFTGNCGNGVVDPGEQCDDGNTVDGDACANDCTSNGPPGPGAGNPVRNGDFALGSTFWNFYSAAAATFSTAGGEAAIDVATASSNVQLYQFDIAVEGGQQYVLRFRARANRARLVQAQLLKHTAPYTLYGLKQTFALDTTLREFQLPFTVPGGDKTDGRLMFQIGIDIANGDQVRIDDVSLAPPSACGNNVLDSGEECDDGNTASGDGCQADCKLPVCGDGVTDAGEQCDDGNTTGGDGCQADCKLPVCGDGVTDAGEQCDDGNTTGGDGCQADCKLPICGDGVTDAGEQCDDGNAVDGDACANDCTSNVTVGANVVLNGDFSAGAANWSFYTNGAGSFTVQAGEARVSIGSLATNIQLHQRDLVLEGSTQYRLRFKVSNSGGADLSVRLLQHPAPYDNYGLDVFLNVTSVPQTVELLFTTSAGDKADGRLMFWMGSSELPGTVYVIDDVELVEVTP